MPGRALVIVDMLQTYEHEDAQVLREHVEQALGPICRLVERAAAAGAPVIYVNDSFGDWRSDRRSFIERVIESPYGRLVEPIVPAEDALFVVKARHSIFYETPLEYMLRESRIGEIVLAGQVTEQCILYSALDAHIRHIAVVVPRDAVAAIHEELADAALRMMELNMEATVCDAGEVAFE